MFGFRDFPEIGFRILEFRIPKICARAAAVAGSGNLVYTLYQCLFMVSISKIKIKKSSQYKVLLFKEEIVVKQAQ